MTKTSKNVTAKQDENPPADLPTTDETVVLTSDTEDQTRPAELGEHVLYRVSTQDAANYSLLGGQPNEQHPAEITHVHTEDTVNLTVSFPNGTQEFQARPRGGGQGEWDRRADVASGAADIGGARNTPERLAAEVDQRAAAGERVAYDQQTVDAPHEDAQAPDGASLAAGTNTEADRIERAGSDVHSPDVAENWADQEGQQKYDDKL